MENLSGTVASVLAEYFDAAAERIASLSEPLTEEQFWTNPFPYGNSVGHLLLHLTGNLNHNIGALIAGTGYVRDRDREFAESERPSKQDLLKRFRETAAMVVSTIRNQSPADWSAPFQAERSKARTRLGILFACATHLRLHEGHMQYLSKEWAKG